MNKNQNEAVQPSANRPKTMRIILSVVIAFFVWMAAMLAAPEITKHIKDVPISVDIPTSAMLEVIEGEDTKVSLILDGKQFEIGNYGPKDVRVVADASNITEPGTYEVPLKVQDNGTRSYSVTSISPSSVTLTFEARATKLLQIQTDITGLTTPKNYIAPENEITLDPTTVEISGAESLISRVERAVIEADFSREVTTTQRQNSKITYYDAGGNKLETEGLSYFHQDVSNVSVTIPVKRVATLPLTVPQCAGKLPAGGAQVHPFRFVADRRCRGLGAAQSQQSRAGVYRFQTDEPFDRLTDGLYGAAAGGLYRYGRYRDRNGLLCS